MAAIADNPIHTFGGAARANVPAAAASATNATTRSALRIFVRFDRATAHDLQCSVCEWKRSRICSLVVSCGVGVELKGVSWS